MNDLLYLILSILMALLFVGLFLYVIYALFNGRTRNSVSYKDLLNSPEWKEKRASILKRDNNHCVYCGKGNCRLQVHHKYYLQYPDNEKVYPWEYPDDALISLCDDCHKKVHQKKKIKVYYRSWY